MNVLVEAQREAMLEFLAGGIEQKNAEHLVIDQSPHQLSNTAEQLVQIQDRR